MAFESVGTIQRHVLTIRLVFRVYGLIATLGGTPVCNKLELRAEMRLVVVLL